MPNSFIKSS